ncbi:hypothetical protein [Bacillus cereus]|nr:hypothetical protein [Bacillus cereus]
MKCRQIDVCGAVIGGDLICIRAHSVRSEWRYITAARSAGGGS